MIVIWVNGTAEPMFVARGRLRFGWVLAHALARQGLHLAA